jgi:hypothetical protein
MTKAEEVSNKKTAGGGVHVVCATRRRRHPRRGRACLRTCAHEAVDAAHALRRAAAHARQRCRGTHSTHRIAPYPLTVGYPRSLRRPTPACVAGAGVASPGADVGADVGSRSACAPQSGAAPHWGRSDRTGRRDCRRGRRCRPAVGRSGTGPYRPVGVDSPTGVGDSARATSTVVPATARRLCARRPAARAAWRPLVCRRTGRLFRFFAWRCSSLRPLPVPPSLPSGPSLGAARHRLRGPPLAAADGGAASARRALLGVGFPDLPGRCRGPPGAAARPVRGRGGLGRAGKRKPGHAGWRLSAKASRPREAPESANWGMRRGLPWLPRPRALSGRGRGGSESGSRRPRAIPDLAADRKPASGVCLGGVCLRGPSPRTGGFCASAVKGSSHNGDGRITRLRVAVGLGPRAPSCQGCCGAPGGPGELRRNHSENSRLVGLWMMWHGSRTANWQSRSPAAQACKAPGTRRGTRRVLGGTLRVRSRLHTGARHGTQRLLQGHCGYSRYSRGRPLRKGC